MLSPDKRDATPFVGGQSHCLANTGTAAKELAHFGVTVNAISPNAETRIIASIPPDKREQLIAAIPLRRFADPVEMAPAVAFLASDEAACITRRRAPGRRRDVHMSPLPPAPHTPATATTGSP
jgi:hypothetical protein